MQRRELFGDKSGVIVDRVAQASEDIQGLFNYEESLDRRIDIRAV
jgi:hypothetical protein